MFRLILIALISFFHVALSAQCPSVTMSPGQSKYCHADSIELTATNIPAGATVEWDVGAGYDTAASTYKFVSSIYGLLDVRLRITLASGTVCLDTFNAITEVIPPLDPQFAASRLLLCEGPDTVVLTDLTIGSVNRSWVIGIQAYNNTGDSVVVAVNTKGREDVTLIVDDSNGCRTVGYFYDTLRIVSDIDLHFTYSDTTHCVGYSTSFSAIYDGSANVQSVSWYFEGANTTSSNQTTVNPVTYNNPGLFDVALTATTQNGCVYTYRKDDTISLGQQESLALSSDKAIACINEAVTFEQTTRPVQGKSIWDTDSGVVQSSSKYTRTVSYQDTGYQTVIYQLNQNGCITTVQLDSAVYVRGLLADFISNNNIHCDTPHTVDLVNTSDTVSGGISGYQWYIYDASNDSIVDSANTKDHQFVTSSLPSSYDVELITSDTYGCQVTARKENFIEMREYEFNIQTSHLKVCPGGTVDFINRTLPVSSIGVESSYWEFYGADSTTVDTTSTAVRPRITYNNVGDFGLKLVMTNAAGCSDSITLYDTVHVVNFSSDLILRDTAVCFQDSIRALNNSIPQDAGLFFDWTLRNQSGVLTQMVTGDSALFGFSSPGTYDVKLVQYLRRGGTSFCIDSSEAQVFANGVKGVVSLDTLSGCSPLTIRPQFAKEYNAYQGSSDTSLRYNWSVQPLAGVSLTGETTEHPTFVFDQERQYRVSVFVTNSVGCSYFDQEGASIRVGVVSRFNPKNGQFCVGQTIPLENRSLGDPTHLSFAAFPSGNEQFDSIDFDNRTVRFDQTGTYRVYLYANKDNSCEDTSFREYEIIPFAADFDISDSFLICAPQQVQLSNRSISADSLFWYFGDGDSLAGDTSVANHTYLTNDTFDITLVAQHVSGCKDTLRKDDALIIQGPKVGFDVDVTAGCEALLVQFTNTSEDYDLAYMDYGDGTPLDSSTSLSHTYTVSNGDSLQYFSPTLYVENSNGCALNARQDSVIKVYAKPQVQIVSTPDTFICAGQQIQLSAIGNYIDSVAWWQAGNLITSQSTHTVMFPDSGHFQYKLYAWSARNCAASDSQTVVVHHIPALLYDTAYLACPGSAFRRTVTTDDASITARYDWDMGEPSNPLNLQNNDGTASIVYTIAGLKRIYTTAQLSNGCTLVDSTSAFVIGSDSLPPVSLDYVTVEVNGDVSIHYPATNYAYFDAYELYAAGVKIQDIANQNMQLAVDAANVTPGNTYCYTLRTRDICQHQSSFSREHCAVVLSLSSVSHKVIDLAWTPYVGWDSVNRYEIYREENGSGFQLLAIVDGSTLAYADSNLCENDYSYYIRAYQAAGSFTSNSNRQTQHSLYLPNTFPASIRLVTVNEMEEIEVYWPASTYTDLASYELKKYANDLANQVDVITTASTSYLDADVDVYTNSYIYSLVEIDECDQVGLSGRNGKSILLKGTFTGGASALSWSAYEEWLNGVSHYEIMVFENGVYVVIGTVNATTFTFEDRAIRQETPSGYYGYKVRGISLNGDTSYSNIAYVNGKPLVYVPNAFSPNNDEHNEVFRPSMRFTVNSSLERPDDYILRIFNRWGEMVFESYDRDEAWDGTYLGKPAQQSVYFYRLKVTDTRDRSEYYTGTITLLR